MKVYPLIGCIVKNKDISIDVYEQNGLLDTLITRIEKNIDTEIIVIGSKSSYYVADNLLSRGVTDVMVHYDEDTDSYKFIREQDNDDDIIVDDTYIIG